MTELNEPISASLDRRRMLQVVGAAGAAGVLAACGGGTSDSSNGGTEPDESAPDSSSNGQGDAADEPDETEEPSDDEAEDGENGDADVLASTGDIAVGGGVIGGGVVVTQPTEGEFRAFSSTCTHQGCTVGEVSDGTITCPCHGSQYSAEDGSVQNGPATQALPEVAITVDGDQIVRG